MYDLHSLGWNSFQQLCVTVTGEVLGQTVEAFLDTDDGGRDGAFTGNWKPNAHEDLRGRFVIQCKFTSRINHVLRPSDLADEIPKAKKLVKQGLCDVYILMTNAGVSGKHAEGIQDLFRRAGAKHVLLLGATWITRQILENKRLRMLVPRVYGLGDLSQILDERAYVQARAILDSLREDLAKVVVTDAYRMAAKAIDKHGFVLLIGEPAAGKTTIASMLAMAAVDQWNASMLKLDDPSTVVERWSLDEPSQFFWLDDAFGVTQYEAFLVHGWNHILPQVKTMLRRGAKIVMTSRDYIYNRARKELKEGAFPLLRESQVVIDVHALSPDERRQILYNHLKLGKQPRPFRVDIKPHLEAVAAHERFIPETARRLADPFFTRGLLMSDYALCDFVARREQLLHEVLQGLDRDSKAALALIYMRNDHLESPIALISSEAQAIERLGSTLGGCVAALEALHGSLVIHSYVGGDSIWRFKHPTIGDAYATSLAQNPELLGVFIQGSALEELVEQVTCGDVGIEKAVIIPKSLFPQMLARLGEAFKTTAYKPAVFTAWRSKSALQWFLARRCSKDFLAAYVAANPGILEVVARPGLYLYAVSEVDLAIRLHDVSLLPEDTRRRFVATVSRYAIDGEDLYALDSERIRPMFTDDEFESLISTVHAELLPRLDDVRRDWEFNRQASDSPEEHMGQLLEWFDVLKKRYGSDPKAAMIIDREKQRANEWISEHTVEEPEQEPRVLGAVEPTVGTHSVRSIFDDIDA